MKRKSKMFLTLAMAACMALGTIGFTACEGTAGENGKSAYEIAVDNGYEGTEQEWLDSLKGTGKDGKDGKDGVNGTNGTNGADGKDGVDGTNGKDGNGWHYGNGEPAEEVGKVGDLYLDLENGDVWTKEENGWQKSELNIKGGEQAPEEPAGTAITISANSAENIAIELEAGVYELKMTLAEGVTAVNEGLTARVDGSTYTTVYNMYDGHNGTYSAVLTVLDDSRNITLNNTTGEDITGEYVIITYVPPTLKADGTEYVVPLIYANTSATYYRSVFLPIEPLEGKYRITISNHISPSASSVGMIYKNGDDNILTGRVASISKSTMYCDVTFTSDIFSLAFKANGNAWDYNITIKIEPIE